MRNVSFLWLSPLLTSVGRKFRIDAHYFARHSSLVLLGHAVSIIRGIITGYLVARLFRKEIYGEYQFILSVVGMLGLFGLSGLGNPVSRAWARNQSFSLRTVARFQLGVCLIGSLILLACIPFLGHYHRESLWPLFVAAAVLFPLPSVTVTLFGGYTVGKARFDLALRASLIWSTLMVLATAAILVFRQSALLMLVAGMGIPSLVYIAMSRGIRPPVPTEAAPDQTRTIIRYGLQYSLATLPADLVWYIDKLMISHFLGLGQLATFSVAILIPEQVKIFLKQFLPVTFAKQAMGDDTRERRRKLMRVVILGMGIFAVGIAVYIALCPWLIPLLFPNYDAKVVILLTSICAATLITNPGSLLEQYLEAQAMVREIKFTNWNAAVAFLLSLVLLVPTYGLLGAILARGIFRFVYTGSCWWFVWRSPLSMNKAPLVPVPGIPPDPIG